MLELDNTKRSQFVTCDRKGYWQYERDLKPNQGSTALRYGIVWHSTQEGFYGHIRDNGWTHDGKALEAAIKATKESWEEQSAKQAFFEDYRTLENCLQSLLAYLAHFNNDEGMLEVTDVEKKFKIKMNFSERDKRLFPYAYQEGVVFAGRIDSSIKLSGRAWRVEQKSTGQALSVQKARLRRNPQDIGYAFADKCISEDPAEGCLITLHHLSAYKSKKTGLWGAPKIDFDRVPQIYTDRDLLAWRESFLYCANKVVENRSMGIWPMQQDSCYQYSRCTFTSLCEQNAPLGHEILEGFFEDEPWEPAPNTEMVEEKA